MKYSLSLPEALYDSIRKYFDSFSGQESAGYLYANASVGSGERRLLAASFDPVSEDDVIARNPFGVLLKSESYVKALRRSRIEGKSFIFVHSHPGNYADFSAKDDLEEPELFRIAYRRGSPGHLHASLVLQGDGTLFGRIWHPDLTVTGFSVVRVIGSRFKFFFKPLRRDVEKIAYGLWESEGKPSNKAQEHWQRAELKLSGESNLPYFDRQVRAFGANMQTLLKRLHVVVVGGGGTGSIACEQLIRLGIGELTVIDPDNFSLSNVNRVYGSRVEDDGRAKVKLVQRTSILIGLSTKLNIISGNVLEREVALKLKESDLIFGCTDDNAGRSVLQRLAYLYYIPVIDMGVEIDSKDGLIKDVTGRVTVLTPGQACLTCRNRIDSSAMLSEVIHYKNPTEAADRLREGYIPELGIPNPAVISFTSAIASQAVNELLHRLTGFMGEDRRHSETIVRFSGRKNAFTTAEPNERCFCSSLTGRGDMKCYLDRIW